MKIGKKIFSNGTYVMAIINLTPDSFFAPSRKSKDDVLFAADRAIREGAAILDLGPQSTRPGYVEVSSDEEIERFAEPLRMIKERFDIPVSLDTYYSESARIALEIGADMINDIWGLTYDGKMAETIAKSDASVCIMHNSKTSLEGDIWGEIKSFLRHSVEIALQAGVDRDKICLDGGIGFAKNVAQNFELLNGYEHLGDLGYPTLLGCSRKSMFGGKVEDRLAPTLVATCLAVQKGVRFVRVHDVRENVEVIAETLRKMKGGSN